MGDIDIVERLVGTPEERKQQPGTQKIYRNDFFGKKSTCTFFHFFSRQAASRAGTLPPRGTSAAPPAGTRWGRPFVGTRLGREQEKKKLFLHLFPRRHSLNSRWKDTAAEVKTTPGSRQGWRGGTWAAAADPCCSRSF